MLTNNGLTIVIQNIQLNIALFWEWMLFTNNVEITDATILSDLTEANWPGYARVNNGSNVGPSITGGVASTYPLDNPTFNNADSVGHGFYGWGLIDRSSGLLVDAVNVGLSTIAPGGSVIVVANYTLQEG